MTDLLLTWLCTYLLHSSVLIGGLWAVERAGGLARLSGATQESLWRLALLGGLLSASLPLLPAATWPAPAEAPALAAAPVPQALPAPPALAAPVLSASDTAPAAVVGPVAHLGTLALPGQLPALAQELAIVFVGLWLAGGLLSLAGVGLQWAWLRRTVARLPVVSDTRWTGLTAGLSAELGLPPPALRQARGGWASPLLAPGRMLCLPAWCLDLPDDQARAVLGHELAHLRRRDPAWRLLAALLRAALWPQVLNRVALHRLDLLAELACDAAAAPSGQRHALAACLLRCAEALKAQGTRPGPALACGAATTGSPLLARVRHLLQGDAAQPRERRALRWGLAAALLALLLALPAVVISHTEGRGLMDRLGLAGVSDGWWGRSTRIVSRHDGSSFSARLQGTVSFNDAEDDVQALSGRLVVETQEAGVTREMSLNAVQGRIERSYRVDGQPAALDAAARQWWAGASQRAAGYLTDPAVRAAKLFARGGIEAVLADAERAAEDGTGHQRIVAAAGLPQPLPGAALDRLVAAAGGLHGGFERREALVAIARRPLAEPQQLAWLAAVAATDGDFERRGALQALAPQLSGSPAVLAAWRETVEGMGGDFERRSAIQAQVAAMPQPAVLAAALQAASALDGDFEQREALVAVARRLQGDEAGLVEAYAAAAGHITGGFERREALNALLDRPRLATAGLVQVLASAEAMDGDFERLQVLLRVAERLGQAKPVDASLVDRLRRAGRSLHDHERGQLEKALDRIS